MDCLVRFRFYKRTQTVSEQAFYGSMSQHVSQILKFEPSLLSRLGAKLMASRPTNNDMISFISYRNNLANSFRCILIPVTVGAYWSLIGNFYHDQLRSIT